MSTEAVLGFRQKVNGDASLQEQIRTAESLDVIAIAKASGFEFTQQELQSVVAENNEELSEFELEMVSGGWMPDHRKIVPSPGCALGRG
jgi:predicted ribosomally synthesized peptide with nif11-like leader